MVETRASTANGAPPPREADIRQRIINHMNKDHADSLSLYLRSYCKIPASSASPAKMTDITTAHMIVESPWGRNIIPFDPPMNSLSEARPRIVELHNESLKMLDLSEIKVDKFVLPNKLWQWGTHMICIWCFATLPFPSILDPKSGSIVSRVWSFNGLIPAIAQLSYYVGPLVFWGMILIHTTEAGFMAWGRLRRHRVGIGSSTWIAWVLSTFTGGIASFTRFDEMVKGIEDKKKKNEGKH